MASEVIEAMNKLYQVILTQANDPLSKIRNAPPEGHILPERFEERLREHGKTPTVIDLIKYLPYAQERFFAPETEAINYAHQNEEFYYGPEFTWRGVRWPAPVDWILPHELPLTSQTDEAGLFVVVDTETWEARVCDEYHTLLEDIHEPESRGKIKRKPAAQVFDEWRAKFLSLEWMVKRGAPEIIEESLDEGYSEVKRHPASSSSSAIAVFGLF